MSNHHFLVVSLPYPVQIPIKQMLYRSKTLQLPHFFLDLRPPSAQSWALSFDKRSSRVDCANHMGFKETSFKRFFKDHLTCSRYMAVCQNLVPLVNIKIAGIYGCSSPKNGMYRYWSIPIWLCSNLCFPLGIMAPFPRDTGLSEWVDAGIPGAFIWSCFSGGFFCRYPLVN